MKHVLIPQFSLRWVLLATAVCGGLFLIAAQAKQGSAWAAALTMATVALVVVMLVHGVMFFLLWLFSLLAPRWLTGGDSPFAARPAPRPGER